MTFPGGGKIPDSCASGMAWTSPLEPSVGSRPARRNSHERVVAVPYNCSDARECSWFTCHSNYSSEGIQVYVRFRKPIGHVPQGEWTRTWSFL